MGILKSCCCCKSLKTGSVVCGIYTTVLYLMFLCAGIVHTLTASDDTPLFCFSLLLVLFSSLCVISSFLLFYGIFTNNRFLLLPWLLCIVLTTILEVTTSFYYFPQVTFDPFLAIFFLCDVLICSINVYSLLCVSSQYQNYKADERIFKAEKLSRKNRNQSSKSSLTKYTTTVIQEDSMLTPPLIPLPDFSKEVTMSKDVTKHEHYFGCSSV